MIFNRAGTVAYVSGFNDGSVRRIDVAIGVPMSGSHVGPNAFRLALSADENRLYVSTTDGAVYALRTSDVSAVGATSAGGSLQGLVVAANGDLYVSATSGRISRVEAKAFAVNGSRNVGGLPQDIALTADNTELWVANESGWVDVLDAATLSSQQRILTPSARPFGLAISPDGVQVWVTSPSSGEVVTIDRATRAVQRMVSVNGVPRRIAFTPDGRTVVVANEGGWIDVIK